MDATALHDPPVSRRQASSRRSTGVDARPGLRGAFSAPRAPSAGSPSRARAPAAALTHAGNPSSGFGTEGTGGRDAPEHDPPMTASTTLLPSVSPDGTSPEPPGLAEPPQLSPVLKKLTDASRTAFKYGNRYGMIAVHRAGLSSWLGNPLTGWQCLVTTTGRRSGLPRHTPLGYLVVDGAAWVLAGYGPSTFWYRNLLDDPRVTLLLPGRPPIAAQATEARDPSVRARIIPALARSMALPGC